METVVAERKSLKMHKKLLLDVIKRQAGTLHKAILEGTMNGIEAGARSIEITFLQDGDTSILSIDDDGRGIVSIEEVENFFETFGTPHDESEGKVWAQFRMGRGQLFAFGRNTWRTSTFEMVVDVNEMGLSYELKKDLPFVEGCHIVIELYENPIGNYIYPTVERLQEKIEEQVNYVDIPVFFNGIQMCIAPSELKWDMEDENAYYSFGVGDDLKIYNLGVYVRNVNIYTAGVTGIIVSKKMLGVNFARNDIQSDCTVYKGIQEVIKANRAKNATKKKYKRMPDYERHSLQKDLRDGTISYNNIKGSRIFKTSQGKWQTLNMIFKNVQKWTFAPEGSRIADSIMERGEALCLSDEILINLNYKGENAGFFDWLLKEQLKTDNNKGSYEQNIFSWERDEIEKNILLKTKTYIAYDKSELNSDGSSKCLTDGFSSKYTIVPNNKLSIVEKRIVKLLNGYECFSGRTICIGTSDEALAWTDGDSFIVLERNFLKDLSFNYVNDVTRLFTVLCHELAHDDTTEGTHYHSPQFYEKYYELTTAHRNPLVNMVSFNSKLYDLKRDRVREMEKEKEKAEKAKLKNKLGIK
jgi:hypothetical protein